jgi:hypothetical protein
VARLVLFAKWISWQGGVCWGPRLLMPIVPLLIIAAVETLDATVRNSWQGRIVRFSFVVLSLASAGISFLSIRVPYEQWWGTLSIPSERAQVPQARTLLPGTPGLNAESNVNNFVVAGSTIVGDIDLLEIGKADMAPELWRDGHGEAGWSLLALSGALLLAGGLISTGRPRLRSRSKGRTGLNEPDRLPG